MIRLRHIAYSFLLYLLCLASAWGEQPAFLNSPEWQQVSKSPSRPMQVVTIQAQQGFAAQIALWESMNNNEWKMVLGPWPAVIGKNGMALPGQKKEGDGKSPAGLFPISLAFGEQNQAATGLPYRMTTEQDIWVDDPLSPLYNQWSQLPTSARSFEKMKRKDPLYRLGLVVDYNKEPTVAGAGSAIFIHIWRNESKGTAGCAALADENLRTLLQALQQNKRPAALFLR